MATYSLVFPVDVVAAMKVALAEDGEGLTGRAVVTAWLQGQIRPLMVRYRRQGIGTPKDLEAARVAAEEALAAEIAARKKAENAADSQALADAAEVA